MVVEGITLSRVVETMGRVNIFIREAQANAWN